MPPVFLPTKPPSGLALELAAGTERARPLPRLYICACTYADMPADDYEVDYIQSPIRVHMKGGFSTDKLNRYRLQFDTANTTVPEFVKQAAFMIIGHYYENRQDVGKERIFEVPMNSRFLLDRYRKQVFT